MKGRDGQHPRRRARPVGRRTGDLLAVEIRHSILLLGWSLGLMGAFAVLLLLLTTRLGSWR